MTVKEMASLGGNARAAKMTKEAQSANGRKAALTRWAKEPKRAKKQVKS